MVRRGPEPVAGYEAKIVDQDRQEVACGDGCGI